MLKKLLGTTGLIKFADNDDGVVAIEFAFIIPILLLLYTGVIEVGLLISADRSVSHSTSVAADLASQPSQLNADEVENILSATLAVLNVSDTKANRVSISLTSYNVESGTITLQGHASLGSSFTSPADASGINNRLLNETSGIIIARVEYIYESFGRGYENSMVTGERVTDFTLSETFMLKPRQSSFIPINNGNALTCSYSNGTGGIPNVSCS